MIFENPANGSVVGTAARGGVEDAKAAIDFAYEAHNRERRERTPANISRTLQITSDLVRQNETELVTTMTLEQGKTLAESRGEIRFFAHTLEYYAGLKARGSQVGISDSSKLAIVEKEPLGVVAGIVPWNNPELLMGAKVASSLAAGNSIVIKSASTKAAHELRAGTVLVNSPYGAGRWEVEVPMEGFKQSWIGRECGIEGLESYTESKTIIMG